MVNHIVGSNLIKLLKKTNFANHFVEDERDHAQERTMNMASYHFPRHVDCNQRTTRRLLASFLY